MLRLPSSSLKSMASNRRGGRGLKGRPTSAIGRSGWMLIAGIVLALGARCSDEPKRVPNVILMTLDTLTLSSGARVPTK
jgi:hypothetical protein